MTTPCFTLQYAAPEVLKLTSFNAAKNGGYDESCDIWSLGVILVSIEGKFISWYIVIFFIHYLGPLVFVLWHHSFKF